MPGVETAAEATQSLVCEQGLGPAGTGWLLTHESLSFFTLSDEPFEFTSALSASLIGTCLEDLVPGLVMAGAVTGMEAVATVDDNDSGCDDEDDDDSDDATGGDAADAVCLDVVWPASNPERCSRLASSRMELVLLCWSAPTSPSPLKSAALPCLW